MDCCGWLLQDFEEGLAASFMKLAAVRMKILRGASEGR